ncbi:NAD-binding protein [Mycena latifolia]|nr:NAD-binding protein [Mycena latifolia]
MPSKGTAVVTGAAQGIGRAIALRLTADGFDVAVNDIAGKSAELQGAREEIERLGRKADCFLADVTVETEVRTMLAEIVAEFGGVDMVANAGICTGSAFLDVSIDDWDHTMSVNVRGVFLCYRYAARQMVAQGRGGRIIGAFSMAGKQGAANFSCYSASKFAVRGLTQATGACLCGSYDESVDRRGSSLRIGCARYQCQHGIVESPMTDSFAHKAGIAPQVIYDRQAAKTPLGKNCLPEDVAAVVSYLASAEASFVTGQTISVNGGRFFD